MEYLIFILIGVIGFLYYQNKEKDKKLNGELRETQLDGSIRVGKYKNGVQYGECVLYRRSGKIIMKMNYENGKLNGDFIKYGYNENIIEKGQYLNNEKIGDWLQFYENGQIKFEDGKSFYENGSVKSEVINNKSIAYYEDGSLKYEGFDNQSIEYYENGNIKRTVKYEYDLENPKLISIEKENKFYPNSNFSEKNKFEYRNLRRYKCTQILYYENGNMKSKGTFIDTGHRKDNIGKWEYYYENGNLKQEGFYKDGSNIGIWQFYHENGNIESTGELKSWEKKGIWRFFNEDGHEIESKFF